MFLRHFVVVIQVTDNMALMDDITLSAVSLQIDFFHLSYFSLVLSVEVLCFQDKSSLW